MRYLIFIFSLLFISSTANSMTVFESLRLAFIGHPYKVYGYMEPHGFDFIAFALQANISPGVVHSTRYPEETWQLELPSNDDLSRLREKIKKIGSPYPPTLPDLIPYTTITFAQLIGLAMLAQEGPMPKTISMSGLLRSEPTCQLKYIADADKFRYLNHETNPGSLTIFDQYHQHIAGE